MARLLISFLALVAAASAVGAQAFGRFGYSEQTTAPGFLLRHDGFQVNAKGAELFAYGQPYDGWRVSDLSQMGVTATVSTTGRRPRKVHVSELVPGFSLYFDSGFSFTIHSKDCPFLTWPDGSVGPDVPTPPIKWMLISFQGDEPPVVVSFPSGPCSIRAEGSAGGWTIRSVDVDPHWVHVAAPLGEQSASTTSAATLGALVQKITPNLDVWTSPEPVFKSLEVYSDATSVTGIWHFDHPGFLIPTAAQFAEEGGYLATVESPTRDLGIQADGMPELVGAATDLAVRFPVRGLPPGTCLSNGSQPIQAAAPTSDEDIGAIVKLALSILISTCDPKTRELPNGLLAGFITRAQDVPEPYSGEQMPFKGNGSGTDTVAAYALLQSADNSAQQIKGRQNALLLSLLFRRDWDSWLLPDEDSDRRRRTGSLAAVACALSSDPSLRLEGAMFEAGLAAERGLNQWRIHRGMGAADTFLEPIEGLRNGLFYSGNRETQNPFVDMLSSPVHDVASFPVQAQETPQGLDISWLSTDTTPQEISLLGPGKLAAAPAKNVLTISTRPKDSDFDIRALPADEGFTMIRLSSSQPLSLPAFSPPPPYSEVRR